MISTPSSPSEGEILSSDSDKANKSPHSHSGPSVDRHTRTHAAARPPPGSRPVRSRSRSRSPYRASQGQKRRHDDDITPRNDSRRFSVRYEDERHRARSFYDDPDTGRAKRAFNRYDDEAVRRTDSKRQRTRSRSRSRSPYRHSSKFPPPSAVRRLDKERHDDGDTKTDEFARTEGSDGRRGPAQSVSARGKASNVARMSNTHAETPGKQNAQGSYLPSSDLSVAQYVQFTPVEINVESVISDRTDPSHANMIRDGGTAKILSGPAVDEAALIEERRKRREAIKNKYRGPATPLLVQAVHLGVEADSVPSTATTSQVFCEVPGTKAPVIIEQQTNILRHPCTNFATDAW